MDQQPTVVAITDRAWFDHFRPTDTLTRVDEVNSWQPKTQNFFRAVSVGGPFFFRLKRPDYAVAGFGFFAHQNFLYVRTAWEVFADRNGDPTFERFVTCLAAKERTTVYPAGLSAREVEVLHLLAEGKTDREIGAALPQRADRGAAPAQHLQQTRLLLAGGCLRVRRAARADRSLGGFSDHGGGCHRHRIADEAAQGFRYRLQNVRDAA